MQYTVILVPNEEWICVSVPAMPGCVSQGRTKGEALTNILEAMEGWWLTEAEQGRGPLREDLSVIEAGVAEALEIIQEMREAGEIPADRGYQLELTTVEFRQPVVA